MSGRFLCRSKCLRLAVHSVETTAWGIVGVTRALWVVIMRNIGPQGRKAVYPITNAIRMGIYI